MDVMCCPLCLGHWFLAWHGLQQPETWFGKDIWALGVCLHAMLTGRCCWGVSVSHSDYILMKPTNPNCMMTAIAAIYIIIYITIISIYIYIIIYIIIYIVLYIVLYYIHIYYTCAYVVNNFRYCYRYIGLPKPWGFYQWVGRSHRPRISPSLCNRFSFSPWILLRYIMLYHVTLW